MSRLRSLKPRNSLVAIAALVSAAGALAQAPQPAASPQASPKPAAPRAQSKDPSILNFESDVIEGQKRAPDLFLQTENQKVGPEALIYIRPDFNDFHGAETGQRPAAPSEATGKK